MIDFNVERTGDRLIVTLDPGQPIDLEDLASSFAALARIYARHHRGKSEDAPRLFVTRLETGSVIAEIVPLGVLMGGVALMDGGLVITDFVQRVWSGIKYFSGSSGIHAEEPPSNDDAADLKEFTKPLLGKSGASLGIKHARYEKVDGEKRTVVEYRFDEAELNRAAINIDKALVAKDKFKEGAEPYSRIHTEVMLFLEQANRGPGKEKGRTGDRRGIAFGTEGVSGGCCV